MKLLLGLGNIGEKYANTRHNVGFMYLNYLAKKLNLNNFENKNNLQCMITKNEDFILAKPTTMMNNSGLAAKAIIDFYNLKTDDLIVIHDDLDIKIGEYKLQKEKGPKDHNGIESIERQLKTNEFKRLRIGIENRNLENKINGEKYVLSDFTNEEKKILEKVFININYD